MENNSDWSVIGHESAIRTLKGILAQNALNNHAFLFYGQRHLGKTLITQGFIARLLGLPDSESVWQQPDVHVLECLPDKNEIGIEQVRSWQKDLLLKPFIAPYKVGIIQESERLNQESSNALLKVLEEPSGQTVIIMITNDWERVLPTIRSRAQSVAFWPVPKNQIEAGLRIRGASESQSREYSSYCAWRPGLALSWLSDPDLFTAVKMRIDLYRQLMQADQARRSAFMLNQKDFSTESFSQEISLLEFSLEEVIKSQEFPKNKILKIAENLRWGKKLLQQNVSPQIIWEYLIMSL